jgi:acylphosphatase
MKRFSIRVSGKVQGVYYRASTEEKAKEIGLTGFVQNEANGDVYIEAQGDEMQLQQLTEWCKIGPRRALVTAIHISELPLQNEKTFRVKR